MDIRMASPEVAVATVASDLSTFTTPEGVTHERDHQNQDICRSEAWRALVDHAGSQHIRGGAARKLAMIRHSYCPATVYVACARYSIGASPAAASVFAHTRREARRSVDSRFDDRDGRRRRHDARQVEAGAVEQPAKFLCGPLTPAGEDEHPDVDEFAEIGCVAWLHDCLEQQDAPARHVRRAPDGCCAG